MGEPNREHSKTNIAKVRVVDAINQMRAKSGPIYDKQHVIYDAWRQAGRPRRVITLWTVDGPTYFGLKRPRW